MPIWIGGIFRIEAAGPLPSRQVIAAREDPEPDQLATILVAKRDPRDGPGILVEGDPLNRVLGSLSDAGGGKTGELGRAHSSVFGCGAGLRGRRRGRLRGLGGLGATLCFPAVQARSAAIHAVSREAFRISGGS